MRGLGVAVDVLEAVFELIPLVFRMIGAFFRFLLKVFD